MLTAYNIFIIFIKHFKTFFCKFKNILLTFIMIYVIINKIVNIYGSIGLYVSKC